MSTTRVRLPDGSYINVATDDQQAAAAAARKHWENRQADKARHGNTLQRSWQGYKDWVDNTAAPFVDNVADNVLPNWGDELRGTGRAIRAAAILMQQ
jgi:hypothetical protein